MAMINIYKHLPLHCWYNTQNSFCYEKLRHTFSWPYTNFLLLENLCQANKTSTISNDKQKSNTARTPLTEKKADPGHLTNAQQNSTNSLSKTSKSFDLLKSANNIPNSITLFTVKDVKSYALASATLNLPATLLSNTEF